MIAVGISTAVSAVAGTGAVIHASFEGAQNVSGTDTNPPPNLYRGVLAASGTLWTNSSATAQNIESIHLVNSSASSVSGVQVTVGSTLISPKLTIPANGEACYGRNAWTVCDGTGAIVQTVNVTESNITLSDVVTDNVSTTAHGFAPKLVAPAANQLNVLGIGNGETVASNKTIIGSATPSTQAYGDTAAHGTSVEAAPIDHKHGMPAAVTDATIAMTDVTTNNVSTSKHGLFPKLSAPTGLYYKDDLTLGTPAGTYTLPTATSSVLGGVKPDGTSILNTSGVISATAASVGADASGAAAAVLVASPAGARAPTAHASTHVTGGSDVIANVVAAGNAGLMTGADKTKLDGIAAGATAYTLPTATASVLGGVKPDGTSILNTAGAISATAASVGALPSSTTIPVGGTPALTLGTANAAGSAATFVKTDATVLAFDATLPANDVPDGTAVAGTATTASRRDHVHSIPTYSSTPAASTAGAGAVGTSGAAPSRGDHSHQVSTAAPTIALGTAAAAGSATTLVRSDATIVAFDATAPANDVPDGAAVVGVATVASRRDHVHSIPTYSSTPASVTAGTAGAGTSATAPSRGDHGHQVSTAAPTISLGTASALGSATTLVRSDATIVAFDATLPAADVITGGTASAGVATVAARRDHVHAMTNATLTTALTVNTGTVTIVGNSANTSALTLGAGASSVSGANTGDNSAATSSVLGTVKPDGTSILNTAGAISATAASVGALATSWPASPGAIGGSTPASGAFTTLSATGLVSPSTTVGIKGTAAADSAQAGSIGEVFTSTIATGSSVSLTSVTAANVTNIALTAGDWDVWGCVAFTLGSTTTMGYLSGGINSTSATMPLNNAGVGAIPGAGTNAVIDVTVDSVVAIAPIRVNISSGATYYLVAKAKFAASTCKAYGTIYARRCR